MIKIISFDFDGTITKTTFADMFWLEGLPKLYSKKYNVDIKKAKDFIFKEYDKIGKERLEWYDPDYWFERFGIDYSWKNLMKDYEFSIELYPDALPALEQLKDNYELIIISNARREFIDIQIKKFGLDGYFDRTFSTVSDFGMVKKDGKVYMRICDILNIDSDELLHVGDDYNFDYIVPRNLGIKSVYLDRSGEKNGAFIIRTLEELPKILNRF